MPRPRGALDRADWRILKYAFPEKLIYRVDRGPLGMPHFYVKPAGKWMFIAGRGFAYFDNYWFAYAHALKLGFEGDELVPKNAGWREWWIDL